MKRYQQKIILGLWLFVVALSTGLFMSCGGPGGKKPESTPKYASVQIQIGEDSAHKLEKAISTFNDITKVSADIKDGEKLLAHQDLVKSNGVWTGSFERLPIGIDLDFVANAFGDIANANGPIAIFSGSVRKKLVSGKNTITISMTHTEVNEDEFPDVAMLFPAEILKNSSLTIPITVSDTTDFAGFTITSSGPNGFTPTTGIINPVSGSGSMDVSYHAPATAGVYDYTLTVTNKKGNSTIKTFLLNIVDRFSNDLGIDFSPVITRVVIALTGSNLTFTATVVDDKPVSDLSFAWSFDGTLSFVSNSTNPGVLANYASGDIGVAHLTVTDAGGGVSKFSYNITGRSFESPVTLVVGVPDTGYDMVVDKDITFSGDRACNTLLVKNNAVVTFTGNLFCNDVVVRNGKVTINGFLNAVAKVAVETNTMGATNTLTVKGNSNSAQVVEIFSGSTLNMLGDWYVRNWLQYTGSKTQVIPYSSTLPGSGTFVLRGDNLTVESAAVLSADGAGADPRGAGGGYAGSGGGAYGGNGCRGFWDATHAGSAFGDAYSYIIDMGSAGGVYGGGKILVEVTGKATIAGSVTSNGNYLEDRSGGGSGGGILINAPFFDLTGTITANGGNGGYYGGGGGGGRIKIFYQTGVNDPTIIGHFSVLGGLRGGYLNTCDGQSSVIWIDAIPEPPALIAPNNGASVGTSPSFSVTVADDSVASDGRNDDLSLVLEISADNFATVFMTYDQTKDLTGWSALSYKTGDTATFTTPDVLPTGTYQWRVRAVDRSISGDWSVVSTFIVS